LTELYLHYIVNGPNNINTHRQHIHIEFEAKHQNRKQ